MTPDERAWVKTIQEQANRNTAAITHAAEATSKISEAITSLGATLKPLAENIALANVLLAATGSLCAELALGAANPHNRLEEILASFETGIGRAIADQPTKNGLSKRVLKQIDVLREIAERTLQERMLK